MDAQDHSSDIVEKVAHCLSNKTAFNIRGNNTKAFLGVIRPAPDLEVSMHQGVVSYEPTELVVTARCGTPIAKLESLLADQGQMLPFEPPLFGDNDTLGGVIAAGLSGPRRPYAGSARDFVLGLRLINGKAEQLRFGGEVMKNVAGYDVSRLQVGAMGTLGVILDVSLKVLPRPEKECTLLLETDEEFDVTPLLRLAGQSLPISATAIIGQQHWIRLSGSQPSVDAAARIIGGDDVPDDDAWWRALRNHTHTFFDGPEPLWRIAVANHAEKMSLSGDWLYEWGGAQRWLRSSEPGDKIFAEAAAFGGHATCYRGIDNLDTAFQPLTGTLAELNQRLKTAFDPEGLFNPGRI